MQQIYILFFLWFYLAQMWASVCVSTKNKNHLTLSIFISNNSWVFTSRCQMKGFSVPSRAYSLYDVKSDRARMHVFYAEGQICVTQALCTNARPHCVSNSEKWRRPHLYKFNQFCELKGKMDVLMKVVLSKTIKGLFAYVLFADDLTSTWHLTCVQWGHIWYCLDINEGGTLWLRPCFSWLGVNNYSLIINYLLMNKLLNLPIVKAGQSSHFTLTTAYLWPRHQVSDRYSISFLVSVWSV